MASGTRSRHWRCGRRTAVALAAVLCVSACTAGPSHPTTGVVASPSMGPVNTIVTPADGLRSPTLASVPPSATTPPTHSGVSPSTSSTATTASATSTPSATATTPAVADQITMAFTGDMLIHDPVFARAKADAGGKGYDFDSMLTQVAPILRSADFAVCHQETPISDNDVGVSGYPDFNAPHELAADEAWAGWDACDTASNHTVDLGQGGIKATLDSLDAAGIQHTGSYRSEKESEELTIYDVKGVKVGHLAYTYGVNGNNIPHPWSVNLIDVAKIKSDAHRLKQAGADLVIVSVHAGTEQVQAPSSYQKQIDAEIMQSPDVDLIVGAHAHVVQPLKRLADGRWIIYGLGNFLAQQETNSDQAHPLNRDGVIIEVTFARSGSHYTISKVGFVATMVAVPSDVVQIAPAFSHERTAAILRSMGAPVADLTP